MSTEPLWWSRARELRAKGLSYGIIERLVGYHWSSVRHACQTEEWRNRRRQKSILRAARYSRKKSPEAKARGRIVRKAQCEAHQTGQHIDQVLVAWGEAPRRVRQC